MVRFLAVGFTVAAVVTAIGAMALAPRSAGAAEHGAPGARLSIESPRQAELVSKPKLVVRVEGRKAGFRALMGSLDVTRRFHRRDGVWRTTLRRGRDFALGENRLQVRTTQGIEAVWFVAVRPQRGLLEIRRLPGRVSRTAVHLRGRTTRRIAQIRVTVNGHRVHRRSWPRGLRRFDALLGADEGVRFGRNRLIVSVVSSDNRYERISRSFWVTRRTSLAGAGPDRRSKTGRTVRLDGSSTRPPRAGAHLSYRWRIARAPKGSRAKLRHAGSARPLLKPDRRGHYVVRLVTSSGPRSHRGATASASGASRAARAKEAPPSATDQVTVLAAPAIKPIGMPIRTITGGGGIELGGKTYTTSANWIQLLVLDRATLEVTKELGFDIDEPGELTSQLAAIKSADPDQLVIISGGGRSFYDEESLQPTNGWTNANANALQSALAMIGATTSAPNPLPDGPESLDTGAWSAIGVLGTPAGSATQNWGMQIGGNGRPGSLNGYMQLDSHDNYSFVSPEVVGVNTNVSGAKEGSNEIQVGGKTYASSTLKPGDSGFQVVLLDSKLKPITNRTFVTNMPPGEPIPAEVQAMENLLGEERYFGPEQPDVLVIIQSIGTPGGYETNWLDDTDPVANTLPSWGNTLAAEIGGLGGPAAHDQFAQLIGSTYVQSTPSMEGGFSLVASSGLIDPFEQATSVSQAGQHLATSGVTGVIARNRQSQWVMQSPSSSGSGFRSGLLAELAYQPETPFPYNTGPFLAASEWIAQQLDFSAPDVRTAYYEDSGDRWQSLRSQLLELKCQTTRAYTAGQCETLQTQLAKEFPMVAEVRGMIDGWKGIFTESSLSDYVDLQSISADILSELEKYRESLNEKEGNLGVLEVLESFAWVAQAVAGGAGLEEAEPALGAVAASLGMAGGISDSLAGEPSTRPVTLPTAKLGQELVSRYTEMANTLPRIGDILVSDWGKLQQAAHWSNGLWALNSNVAEALQQSLQRSSEVTDYESLLPVVFGEYVLQWRPTPLNPTPWEKPWEYRCQGLIEIEKVHPFEATRNNPSSYVIGARTFGVIGNGFEEGTIRQVRIISTKLEGSEDPEYMLVHNPEVLPQALDEKLFAPIDTSGGLGIDQFHFFGNPAFERWGLTCKEGQPLAAAPSAATSGG